jgi:hypothetical protein
MTRMKTKKMSREWRRSTEKSAFLRFLVAVAVAVAVAIAIVVSVSVVVPTPVVSVLCVLLFGDEIKLVASTLLISSY